MDKKQKKIKIDLRKNKQKNVTPFPYKDVDLSYIRKNKKIKSLTNFLYKKIPTMKQYIEAIDLGNKPFMKFVKIDKTKKYDNLFAYRITPKKTYYKVKIQYLIPNMTDKVITKKIPINKSGSKRDKEIKVEYKSQKYVIQQGRKILKKAKFD